MTKASNILLPYENKWVAVTPDGKRVIASAKDVKVLAKKLEQMKVRKNQAVMSFIPRFDGWYSP